MQQTSQHMCEGCNLYRNKVGASSIVQKHLLDATSSPTCGKLHTTHFVSPVTYVLHRVAANAARHCVQLLTFLELCLVCVFRYTEDVIVVLAHVARLGGGLSTVATGCLSISLVSSSGPIPVT